MRDEDFTLEKVHAVLRKLLPRIYRVGLTETEIARHLDLFKATKQAKSENFDSLRLVLKAALVSPRFLFREETRTQKTISPSRIRLMILPWRTDCLIFFGVPCRTRSLAEGCLGNAEVKFGRGSSSYARRSKDQCFHQQFHRPMAAASRLGKIQSRFGSLSNLYERPASGPEEGNGTFFSHLLRENRPVSEFLTANYTFSNNKLADYYKLEGKFDESFKKVSLSGEKRLQRGGILSHASILTVTSNPTRTSPVKRGRWVLDNLLGSPPKEPPPGIPELEESIGKRPCNDSS